MVTNVRFYHLSLKFLHHHQENLFQSPSAGRCSSKTEAALVCDSEPCEQTRSLSLRPTKTGMQRLASEFHSLDLLIGTRVIILRRWLQADCQTAQRV